MHADAFRRGISVTCLAAAALLLPARAGAQRVAPVTSQFSVAETWRLSAFPVTADSDAASAPLPTPSSGSLLRCIAASSPSILIGAGLGALTGFFWSLPQFALATDSEKQKKVVRRLLLTGASVGAAIVTVLVVVACWES